jgi:hypothetical protein
MTIVLNPAAVPPSQAGAGMTLGEAQTELMARGFDYLPGPRQTIMLNDAKNSFEDRWEFPWLEAVAVGTPPFYIPDLKYVLSVKTQANLELFGIDLRALAQDGTDLGLRGPSRYWYLDGETLMRAWPVGADTLTVYHVKHSPELVNPSDRPLIPGRYHPIWIDLAVVQAYQDSDNYAAAQALQADVGLRMQDVIMRYETRNRQHAAFAGVRGLSEDE